MLEKYIDEKGGIDKCGGRAIFYLADFYETVDKKKAIEYNIININLKDNSYQEKYISYLRLGNFHENETDKIKWWSEGFNIIPRRLECIHKIVEYYKNKLDYKKALQWAIQASENREINHEDLFVEKRIYDSLFDMNFSLVAYYSGKYQLAHDINQRNIKRNINKKCVNMERLLSNHKFFESSFNKNKNLIKLSTNLENSNLETKPIAKITDNDKSHTIHYSTDIRPSIIIVDNFYDNPDEIRKSAINAEFSVKGNYPGLRTVSFVTDEIKNRFENIIGKKITYWPTNYNGSFQYTTKEQKSWIHRDNTDYSAIIYLTPNAPVNAGTVTYKHIATQTQFANDDITKKILDNDFNNYKAWEIVDIIGNKYNRCILFNGKCSHKSNEYFGSDINDGRLFQVFFFDTEH